MYWARTALSYFKSIWLCLGKIIRNTFSSDLTHWVKLKFKICIWGNCRKFNFNDGNVKIFKRFRYKFKSKKNLSAKWKKTSVVILSIFNGNYIFLNINYNLVVLNKKNDYNTILTQIFRNEFEIYYWFSMDYIRPFYVLLFNSWQWMNLSYIVFHDTP